MKYYLAIHKILSFVGTYVEPEDAMLNKLGTEKQVPHVLTYTCNWRRVMITRDQSTQNIKGGS